MYNPYVVLPLISRHDVGERPRKSSSRFHILGYCMNTVPLPVPLLPVDPPLMQIFMFVFCK